MILVQSNPGGEGGGGVTPIYFMTGILGPSRVCFVVSWYGAWYIFYPKTTLTEFNVRSRVHFKMNFWFFFEKKVIFGVYTLMIIHQLINFNTKCIISQIWSGAGYIFQPLDWSRVVEKFEDPIKPVIKYHHLHPHPTPSLSNPILSQLFLSGN
jgi:hypothetical protein